MKIRFWNFLSFKNVFWSIPKGFDDKNHKYKFIIKWNYENSVLKFFLFQKCIFDALSSDSSTNFCLVYNKDHSKTYENETMKFWFWNFVFFQGCISMHFLLALFKMNLQKYHVGHLIIFQNSTFLLNIAARKYRRVVEMKNKITENCTSIPI